MLVYSCITPRYDSHRSDLLLVEPSDKFKYSVLNAKMPKILFHLYFKEEITIWCNGNIYLSPDNLEMIRERLESFDIVVMTHPTGCVYKEAEACKIMHKDKREKIDEQINWYRGLGYPENNGLYACGVIARRNTLAVRKRCNEWWSHITRFSYRDQISFPVVFKNFPIGTIPLESVLIKPHL